MKVMILTAGMGRKLEPLTETRPKPMIEICGEPLLYRILRSLKSIGINSANVVLGHHGERIQNHLSDYPIHDFHVRYIQQNQPSGVGNAILSESGWINQSDYFLLVYGDILFSQNMLASIINSFKLLRKPLASVCLTRKPHDYGIIYMNHEMKITEIIEKPDRSDLGNYILSGAFILPGSFLEYLNRSSENFIEALIKLRDNEGLFASIWEGNWIDIGYPWDILTANQIVMNEWSESRIASDLIQEPGSLIQGPVVIEPGVVLKAGAHILGPCYIGANSFIGHNALLRNYTSVGPSSIIGFGVEMKNSVLFKQAEIGRLSFIGDSILGERVNIGSGSVMVNINLDQTNVKVDICGNLVDSGLKKLGSLVGDGSWIGAGNTFLPGTKISSDKNIPHHSTYPTIPESK